MQEWWISNTGLNMLEGVTGDAANPPRLPDDYIIHFLRTIQEARDSFERLFPTMTLLEQQRLTVLANAGQKMVIPPKQVYDDFQRVLNTQGVRTAGPRGGTRIGGNL